MAAFAILGMLFPIVFGLGGFALFFYILYRVVRKAVRDAYWDTHGRG
jgi:F0F1-type ATP synthase membrane subunit b/b'